MTRKSLRSCRRRKISQASNIAEPIRSPRQAIIWLPLISDHRMSRVSGEIASAPKRARKIPNLGLLVIFGSRSEEAPKPYRSTGSIPSFVEASLGLKRNRAASRRFRPLPAVRFASERCGAASRERPLVHRSAFLEDDGLLCGRSRRSRPLRLVVARDALSARPFSREARRSFRWRPGRCPRSRDWNSRYARWVVYRSGCPATLLARQANQSPVGKQAARPRSRSKSP